MLANERLHARAVELECLEEQRQLNRTLAFFDQTQVGRRYLQTSGDLALLQTALQTKLPKPLSRRCIVLSHRPLYREFTRPSRTKNALSHLVSSLDRLYSCGNSKALGLYRVKL